MLTLLGTAQLLGITNTSSGIEAKLKIVTLSREPDVEHDVLILDCVVQTEEVKSIIKHLETPLLQKKNVFLSFIAEYEGFRISFISPNKKDFTQQVLLHGRLNGITKWWSNSWVPNGTEWMFA